MTAKPKHESGFGKQDGKFGNATANTKHDSKTTITAANSKKLNRKLGNATWKTETRRQIRKHDSKSGSTAADQKQNRTFQNTTANSETTTSGN